MLQRALCAHQEVCTVDYSPHTYLETHHWLKGAVILEKDKRLFHGNKRYKGYGGRSNARIYMKDELTGNIPGYDPAIDDHNLVFEGWEALCERFARPVFFEKSPQVLAHWGALSLLLQWISSTGFNVRIIGLVRNPMAVQYSAFQLFRSVPSKRQFGWLKSYRNMLAFEKLLEPGQFQLVRYEDLIGQTEEVLRSVSDFVGLVYQPEMATSIHDKSMAKWNDDPYFDLELDEAVKQLARHFGYTEADMANTVTERLTWQQRVSWKLGTKWMKIKNRLIDRVIKPIRLRRISRK
jgi:hypothetical protein